jgi:uncharacterized membrane protein
MVRRRYTLIRMGQGTGVGQPGAEDAAELAARVAALEAQVAELQRLAAVAALPSRAWSPRRATSAPVGPPPPHSAKPAGRSLENDIGSKVLSKVAVLLLLVGTAWFLKWAFDNRWIGASGRVLIGLAAGAGIIVWSERFRRTGTPSFSYALKAVGSGVLYLSLWASFQLYHLVPAPVALAAMIAVTAWNAVLALTQDSRLLAAYALLGAYATPMLLATGGNHEIFLFTYLASIAVAVAALLRVKPWNLLLLAPVPVTSVFFIVWWVAFSSGATYGLTALLALLLWAVFAATPLLAGAMEGVIVAVLQPVAAATFVALTLYSVLVDSGHRAAEPWVALGLAAVYLAASRLRRPSLLSAMHLSLAISFITVAIPLKLTGHGITAGWLAEALVVLYMAATLQMETRARVALQCLGLVAILLGTAGALLGPLILSSQGPAFANRAFATDAGACVALVVALILFRRMAARSTAGSNGDRVAGLLFLLLNVVLLVTSYRELALWLGPADSFDFAYSGAIALQGAIMLAVGFWKRAALARWTGLLLLAATIVKMVTYDLRHLDTGYRVISYLALGALLMAVSFAYQKDWLGLHAVIDEDHAVIGADEEAHS